MLSSKAVTLNRLQVSAGGVAGGDVCVQSEFGKTLSVAILKGFGKDVKKGLLVRVQGKVNIRKGTYARKAADLVWLVAGTKREIQIKLL